MGRHGKAVLAPHREAKVVGGDNGEVIEHGHDVSDDVLETVSLGFMGLIARPVPAGIDQNEPVLVLERLDIAEFVPALQAVPKPMLADQRGAAPSTW
jgi:hypothetical protein